MKSFLSLGLGFVFISVGLNGLVLPSVQADDATLLAKLNETANLVRLEKYETVDDKDTVVKFSEVKPTWILYSADQKAGKASTARLAALGPEKLQKARVLVIANVRPIPFFIKPIVYSKLRSSAFRTVLNKDEGIFDLVETKDGELTVLKLNWGPASMSSISLSAASSLTPSPASSPAPAAIASTVPNAMSSVTPAATSSASLGESTKPQVIIESVSHWNPEKEEAPKDIAFQ